MGIKTMQKEIEVIGEKSVNRIARIRKVIAVEI